MQDQIITTCIQQEMNNEFDQQFQSYPPHLFPCNQLPCNQQPCNQFQALLNSSQNCQQFYKKNEQYSFYSKDHTQDNTAEQGFKQVMSRIHFQNSRTQQLKNQIKMIKQQLINKYLKQTIKQFQELSQENLQLRKQYRKQQGKRTNKQQAINQQQSINHQHNDRNYSFVTPGLTNYKTMKKENQSVHNFEQTNNFKIKKSYKQNGQKNEYLAQFVQASQPRMSLTLQTCLSSNIIPTIAPVPKHKRRQSQMTQRKDYPSQCIIAYQTFDQVSESSNSHVHKKFNQINYQVQPLRQSVQIENTKSIFVQFLEELLIQERITDINRMDSIHQELEEHIQQQGNLPSYRNLKHIQQLETQILRKNLKLRQLHQVIQAFKAEIQDVTGNDLKQVNQLIVDLINVKGKYLQMQQKVNQLSHLKNKLAHKENIKSKLIEKRNQKMQVLKQQQKKQGMKSTCRVDYSSCYVPNSMKLLFQCLGIGPSQNQPLNYIKQLHNISKNKQSLNILSLKKNSKHSNSKIHELIESIRQGREKFNQVLKIYQNRIKKIQDKISKYQHAIESQNKYTK